MHFGLRVTLRTQSKVIRPLLFSQTFSLNWDNRIPSKHLVLAWYWADAGQYRPSIEPTQTVCRLEPRNGKRHALVTINRSFNSVGPAWFYWRRSSSDDPWLCLVLLMYTFTQPVWIHYENWVKSLLDTRPSKWVLHWFNLFVLFILDFLVHFTDTLEVIQPGSKPRILSVPTFKIMSFRRKIQECAATGTKVATSDHHTYICQGYKYHTSSNVIELELLIDTFFTNISQMFFVFHPSR